MGDILSIIGYGNPSTMEADLIDDVYRALRCNDVQAANRCFADEISNLQLNHKLLRSQANLRCYAEHRPALIELLDSFINTQTSFQEALSLTLA